MFPNIGGDQSLFYVLDDIMVKEAVTNMKTVNRPRKVVGFVELAFKQTQDFLPKIFYPFNNGEEYTL